MGPLGPGLGRVHILLLCTEPNICTPNITYPIFERFVFKPFVKRGREGTFSIVMFPTLHVHICKPNITTSDSLHQKQERFCLWALRPQGWEGYIFCHSQGWGLVSLSFSRPSRRSYMEEDISCTMKFCNFCKSKMLG